MANITFTFDDGLLRQAKVIATQHDTSLNALVRDYFDHLVASGLQEIDAMNGNLQTLFDYSVGRIGRNKAKSILGVEDRALTAMLRQAGFPPPRATPEKEQEMLDAAKNVRLS